MSFCQASHTLLVSFIRGDLEPMVRARMESHLAKCSDCFALSQEIAASLAAAQSWQPPLSRPTVDRLIERLSPYLEASAERTRPRLVWPLTAGALASLVVLLGMAGFWWKSGEPAVMTQPSLVQSPPRVPPPEPSPAARATPERLYQTNGPLRLVSEGPWDGRVSRQGDRFGVEMSRGLVGLTLSPGAHQSLEVTTPVARVRVEGTRFAVMITEAQQTWVVVAAGKVRVFAQDGQWTVMAGNTLGLSPTGQPVSQSAPDTASTLLSEPFLINRAPATLPRNQAEKRRSPRAVKNPPPEPLTRASPAEQLERAELLLRDGEVEAAREIYRACRANPTSDFYRDLCQLELARVTGFTLGQIERARQLLAPLRRASTPTVSRQAQLMHCELERSRSTCDARLCLRQALQQPDASLAAEAGRLLERWHLDEVDCQP